MDAAQKLICKSLDSLESLQSLLNWEKSGVLFFEVGKNCIQLLHDGVIHWLLSFNRSGQVQVCDSLRTKINSVTKKCVKVEMMRYTKAKTSFMKNSKKSKI